MQIKKSFEHKLIQKAIKRYKYDETIDQCAASEAFYESYSYLTQGKHLKENTPVLYVVLAGTPNCSHIAAKNLLFQGDNECWKYFGRTAQFWSFQYIDTKATTFIDHISFDLSYALYVEREDLISVILEKLNSDMDGDEYKSDSAYIKQQVYPSTYLTHFIVEKLGISNSAFDKVLQFGSGLGIYERVVSEWDSAFRNIEAGYWNSLCEYHLNGIGVTGTKRKDEEFLDFGLIPMELINLFRVRQKLGLDVPEIKHELFTTPMAVFPKIPTGYNPQLDVKFQLVERTKRDIKRYTYEDIAKQLGQEYGENTKIFF
ncbi:MAG: hypothetical protein FWB75_00150 [Oscillospiraceae bacterium]|nr:hypothetical protein [Oscillospiraceae bacterium]